MSTMNDEREQAPKTNLAHDGVGASDGDGEAGLDLTTKEAPASIEEFPKLYEMMWKVVKEWHANDLEFVRITLAWHYGWFADVDGNLKLGDMRKRSELNVRRDGDHFVLVLNADIWDNFNEGQQEAILDHFLQYAAPVITKGGDHAEDNTGRHLFRKRKPDVVEFSDVFERRGYYHCRVVEMGKAFKRMQENPLFEEQLRTEATAKAMAEDEDAEEAVKH